MSRITLTTVMTGPIAGLKTVIKEFLAANDVGCALQTTIRGTSRFTLLIMEGEKDRLYETRDLLVLELNVQFPGIKYEPWDQEDSDKPWPTQLIKRTPGSLTRNSSGFNDEKTPETLTTDETSINERIIEAVKNFGGHIIKAANQASPVVRQVAQTAGELKQLYSRASSLTDGLVKYAWFSCQNRTVFLNTQPFLDWALLIQEVKKVFLISENAEVEIYKKLDDGTLGQIIDIPGIEDKGRYYVLTDTGIYLI
jgi:hypothetical protein